MKNKRFLIPFILVSLLPLLLVAVFYTQLPQEIPMHWDFNGHVTYQSRSQIWWLAGISLIMGIVLYLLPKIDPRKANYQRFEGAYTACCLVIQLFMTLMTGVILVESFAPGSLSVEKVVIGAMGLLFVFLGNFMPKIKSNYFIGFRTPWALSNPDVWNKTQRLGGLLFVLAGLVSMALALLPFSSELRLGILLGALTVACIIPTIASCYWFQKLPKEQQKSKLVEKKPNR